MCVSYIRLNAETIFLTLLVNRIRYCVTIHAAISIRNNIIIHLVRKQSNVLFQCSDLHNNIYIGTDSLHGDNIHESFRRYHYCRVRAGVTDRDCDATLSMRLGWAIRRAFILLSPGWILQRSFVTVTSFFVVAAGGHQLYTVVYVSISFISEILNVFNLHLFIFYHEFF